MMTPSVNDILYPDPVSRAARVLVLRTEIAALKKAYAAGVSRVSYDGKSVDYVSPEEMMRALARAEAELLALSGIAVRRPRAGFATFARG